MPPHRIPPGPGQESVWDYPRPPRLEQAAHHLQVVLGGVVVAETRRAWRVLETSHPPTYYFPPDDVQRQYLRPSPRGSLCEWKGRAGYYTLQVGERVVPDAAWFYAEPAPAFAALRGHLAFYAQLMDACYVDGERVAPQPGGFYGGWITSGVVGPFKGEPGTAFW